MLTVRWMFLLKLEVSALQFPNYLDFRNYAYLKLKFTLTPVIYVPFADIIYCFLIFDLGIIIILYHISKNVAI